MIHTIARYAALLKRDGLSEPQALRKIDDVLRLRALSDGRHATTVEEYLELLLAARCPEYLSHSPGLLTAALALATAEIERGLPPRFPFRVANRENEHRRIQAGVRQTSQRNSVVRSIIAMRRVRRVLGQMAGR